MHAGEDAIEIQHAPHASIALFDEQGRLHGWSPAFADDCAQSSLEFRECLVGDVWPEFNPGRWKEIWRNAQEHGAARVVQVVARTKQGTSSELVELEIGRFVSDGMPLVKIEVRRSATRRLHLMQQEILQSMANGAPLRGIMETLCRRVEALAPSVICSVLAIDRDQQLRHIASPSLPLHYSRAIDGVPIGPKVGSCGTAAFRGEAVEVTDIASDPLWEDYKHLALPLGLRACWSSPIKAPDGRVVGAFAFYYPRPRGPTVLERQVVATCLHLCMIALEHEETRSRAYEQAFTDPLTQLPNRARFQQRVSEAMAIVAETGQRIAIQYIGLDRFQAVNELLGYAAGDELLKVVASRLRSVVKDRDAVARIGGDEFAVIKVGDFKDEDIAKRARGIIEIIGEPYLACGQRLELGASIGIALGVDANSADELIQDAALAMRRVKELGRGTYFFYEKELNARMQARRRAEADLRDALTYEQFELYFQPIFDLQRLAVTGAETLLRWHHPERGMVSPAEFIALAEQCGLIEQLGAWAIRKACLAAVKWPRDIAVAVNLSPMQFDNPGLVRTVAAALEQSGLDPSRLELEITESVLLRDSAVNIAVLDELKDLGVSIALDDFGTGYSSLSYLHRFSFDRVKIDHSFIRDITRNEGSLKIVRAIVMLAHSLGLEVTAEGVETDEQLAAVRGEGCDAVQGHYTGTPTPVAAFLERLGIPGDHRVSAA
ncbi:MAG: EAL domain-containing protein [Hyphomicrobium sp.]|uniref:putative bifunctional diguanylate cyclase/phosphodiesterase n=1 Tax=Hyphomicrobium sp. TaxID=82 RepID=UPI001329DAF2|nr:EAL domain-containing protein [Hyphomicrobium sp.]KAB2941376.1 MAG: EAL domain-containing protein [Hyphomicrobium sp.]MBZ0212026.1 EAL domain-containing protein [Hyphomicrobium sp.]